MLLVSDYTLESKQRYVVTIVCMHLIIIWGYLQNCVHCSAIWHEDTNEIFLDFVVMLKFSLYSPFFRC